MIQPLAGHALTAAGRPPANWSANSMFPRFCKVTVPPASVIWEPASPPPENFGITLTGPDLPSIPLGVAAGVTLAVGEEEASVATPNAFCPTAPATTVSVLEVATAEPAGAALAKA